MPKTMFEEAHEEGWEMVESLGGYHTDHGFPFYVTKWFHAEENAETYVVIGGDEKSYGMYKTYQGAEARSKYLSRFYSSDDSGCYCSE